MRKYEFEESEVVYWYLQLNSSTLTAHRFGCSSETILRILKRAGVPRVVKKIPKSARPIITESEERAITYDYYQTNLSMGDLSKIYHRAQSTISNAIKKYGNGIKHCERNSKKITDDELIAEIQQGSNCDSIAKRYNITPENVYRRARKLGYKLSSMGWGGHWYSRCRHYGRCDSFDESITLDAVITKYDGICQICGQKVDKTDIENGHIRKIYPTVDHIIPLSKGGSHTWDNVQLAHMGCNAGKCDSTDYTVKAKEV